jgi:hypothetical protein
MPSTYSTSLKLELIQNGEQSGIWGQTTNKNFNLLEQAIAGVLPLTLTGDYTLTNLDGITDEARNAVINCSGLLGAPANVIAPSVQKTYIITNNTGANVTIKTATDNGVTVLNTTSSLVYCDGTNFYNAVTISNVIGNQTISGNEVILGNVTAGGNVVVTSNVSSLNGNLTFTSNTNVITAATNTGAYTPPTGTSAQRPSAPNGGMSRFNTDIGAYEIFNGTVWQPITGAYAVSYLIVAGGGGGGLTIGAGGGAGGLLANVASVQPGTAYTVTVGSGGAAGVNGGNSSALSLTAIGGGAGNTGNAGGSGGGAGSGAAGAGTSGQGFAGGLASGSYGGGGGGAGAVGGNAVAATRGGDGGIGVQSSITGTAVYYAGGAAGYLQGIGGTGGTPGNGSLNAGGGGDGYDPSAGKNGVVIISYPSTTQRATGGNITTYTSGGQVYWVHTFTTSGTFTA